MARFRGFAKIAMFAAVVATSSNAAASNGMNPRTPVLWEDTPCRTVVDRSDNPVLHIPYGIPLENVDITQDEVEDSRRHQFIALCQPTHPQDPIPNWLSRADVEAAEAVGLLDASVIGEEQVMETSDAWSDCFFRINEDDERRQILFDVAAEGVYWDTAGLEQGVYTILGYTWEPAFNLWSLRPGFVKIVDGSDPSAIGPGAAITSSEIILYKDGVGAIEGCVDTSDGSTLTAYYANTAGSGSQGWEPDWVPFAEEMAVDAEEFSIDFAAPEEVAGNSLMIRVDVTDPTDRTYTAYMTDLVIVLMGNDPNDCPEDGSSIIGAPGCDDGGGSEPDGSEDTGGESESGFPADDPTIPGGTDSGNASAADGASDASDDGTGCSCRAPTDRDYPPAGLAWLLAAFAWRRLRRGRP